ncbi:MAG: PASTA domain-containing protein [Candidatus Eiseniibacteriota bacterium]
MSEERDDEPRLYAVGPGEPEPPPTPPPPARVKTHRIRTAFVMTGLAMLAFATGLLLFNYLLMPRFIHGQAEVRVPDLTNLTLDQAEKQVAGLHLQISRAGERFDPSAPSGFILSQDPPQGTPVRGRHRVMVVVSLGEEFSSVPALAGESQRAASVMIDRVGLALGGVTHAYLDDVGEGLVVDSDPPAETVMARGAPVGLLLSAGARRETFVMPDLLGREAAGVQRQLSALGLKVVTPAGSASAGPVVFQDPSAGSRISLDATVTLRVMGRMIR